MPEDLLCDLPDLLQIAWAERNPVVAVLEHGLVRHMTQDNRAALFAFLADNHIPAIGLMEDSPDPEGIPYDGTIQRAQMATGFELRPSIEGIIASYSAGPTGNETLC